MSRCSIYRWQKKIPLNCRLGNLSHSFYGICALLIVENSTVTVKCRTAIKAHWSFAYFRFYVLRLAQLKQLLPTVPHAYNNWDRTSYGQLYMWKKLYDRIISPVPRIISPVPRIIPPVPCIILPIPRINLPVSRIILPVPSMILTLSLRILFYKISDLFPHCSIVCCFFFFFFNFILININIKNSRWFIPIFMTSCSERCPIFDGIDMNRKSYCEFSLIFLTIKINFQFNFDWLMIFFWTLYSWCSLLFNILSIVLNCF